MEFGNLLVNGINIMLIEARLKALENVVFGLLNAELGVRGKENQMLFLQFYVENLTKLRDELPSALAQNQVVQIELNKNIQEALDGIRQIESELGNS